MARPSKLTDETRQLTKTRETLVNYVSEMLSHIAEETNVKHVYIKDTVTGDTYDYQWDTIKQESIGFKNDEDAILALSCLFTYEIIRDMKLVRNVVSDTLRQRSEHGIKVRQPLNSITINSAINPRVT